MQATWNSAGKAFKIERGTPSPYGATLRIDGVNFALFSKNATGVALQLWEPRDNRLVAELPLDPHINRTGEIWHIFLRGLNPDLTYSYRIDGPRGARHRFDRERILIDPYALALSGVPWGSPHTKRDENGRPTGEYVRRCMIVSDTFDWKNDVPPNTHLADTIIYELHVRGFTVHPSSGVTAPGTYMGLTEKIPYLKDLGVTAVELMPVFEFDETEQAFHNPKTGEPLKVFWGYAPISVFSPKANYARDFRGDRHVAEFREMVREFHRAGLEVFLDVVFNHTGEGNEKGPTVSFRGIDNETYYMLRPDGSYFNFSGCGNTLNCNHRVIRDLIRDCLRYWVAEMHIDGFRFDLASVLGRDSNGKVLEDPPIIKAIAEDPMLQNTKIIAESWDAMGLNQVGQFPYFGRWAEWNGKYRDDIRMFLNGDNGTVANVASRLAGSSDLYMDSGLKPYHSINFVACHDGFTLNDLVSYNKKHNEENGEDNRDGEDFNHSDNCGYEGPTDNPEIGRLRERRMKNHLTLLFCSLGVPMILAGDEFARTQQGNNNAYCQDNEISWVDWSLLEKRKSLHRFVRLLTRFRKAHPLFARREFYTGRDVAGSGLPDCSWHSHKFGRPDWSPESRTLAMMLDGAATLTEKKDCHIYLMINAGKKGLDFELPRPQNGKRWARAIDTFQESPNDICEAGAEHEFGNQERYFVHPHTAVVLVAK